MFANSITKEDINLLELKAFEGEITIVDTQNELVKTVNYLQNHTFIGFDTEAVPQFTKGSKRRIVLLQLATQDKAFLIRVDILGMQKEIIDIFENKNLIKIGAGIVDDMKALRKMKSFNPAGFIDLQEYTDEFNIEDNSLLKMTAIILGFRISKSQRLSNWGKEQYTNAQKLYAATDAWVCYEMYQQLNQTKNQE